MANVTQNAEHLSRDRAGSKMQCVSHEGDRQENAMSAASRYKADIAGGSLKPQESRVIASLLLNDVSEADWKQAIEIENVLQKRSPGTAKRQASLIRARLNTMGPELWRLVQDGSNETATHALFAAAIKHSNLLADFLDQVVREQFRMFKHDLPRKLWSDYIERLHDQEPDMPKWAESTTNKLGDSVYQILKEVGYILDTRKYLLQPVRISGEVMAYLRDQEERYVLQCIQVSL